ncbi:helix-turn-helix domain-containing protein [Rhizobium sp. LjRoot254]|uniref:helix-turn-helix domain-containing protein n=1 Tax=Rhizobium sp. LjRoot254 TaxID=3342297 RepID=UPI003ED1132E
MAEAKIFAGPRVRRLRNGLGMTQTAMAEGLGISPSYLNLIERNQRPLTVQLILKMASVYKIDIEDLQGETGSVAGELRQVFADPLLAGEVPGGEELVEVAEAAPNAAQGMIKLHRAYREQAARLSDLAGLLAEAGHDPVLSGARLPMDEVRDRLENRPNFHAAIEDAAEAFHTHIGGADDIGAALREWLRAEHGIVVRTLPIHAMPNLRRRYDRHSMRLFLSERLYPHDQLREIAQEACQIALRDEISAALDALALSTNEARRIARFELARYAALAVMMPYGAFIAAARRARYDVGILCARFRVSFEQAASRLTSMGRPDAQGIPFFTMEIDIAGNRIRRAGANGFPQAAFGGQCPKLNIHAAFAAPGQVLPEIVEMPGGARYLTIARTLEGPIAGFGERVRRTALLLACEQSHAGETAYAEALPGGPPLAVGPACRLCERPGCLARAEPPVTRPLGLDEMVAGMSVFDFQ